MTDETTAVPTDPLQTAIAGGYKEPEAPTKEDRIADLIAGLEHAMKHNAPVSLHLLREAKSLLGVEDPEPATGDQADL
jgi:hypothetical protein